VNTRGKAGSPSSKPNPRYHPIKRKIRPFAHLLIRDLRVHPMTTVDINLPDLRKPPALRFPQRCVNCGRAADGTTSLKLATGAQKRGRMVMVELDVPLCAGCKSLEDRIGNVTWIPFAVSGFLLALLVFVPVLLIAPQGDTAQTMDLPWVLAGSAALAAGMAGGSLVEFILRLIFTPVFGRSLTRRPLTVMEVLGDTQHILGLSARLNREKTQLQLIFENERVANEFQSMNRGSMHED
jgi:hypothetical protein